MYDIRDAREGITAGAKSLTSRRGDGIPCPGEVSSLCKGAGEPSWLPKRRQEHMDGDLESLVVEG